MSKADWCNIKVSVPFHSTGQWLDLRTWLLDNIDERDWDFDGADPKNPDNRIYYFSRKKDAVLFALRWS